MKLNTGKAKSKYLLFKMPFLVHLFNSQYILHVLIKYSG
ncbi:hypothetical protein MADA3029_360026 [Vibrio nigripulchritudo MADA3029]|nr:hypothetical protein VIBNIMADA3020_970016 [Vibrio nigripulchritudo MADA3020]CCN52268.1 hypothetical protein VIBNIMADA3021_1220017 [Vibrio nigripulchritudo MADA3021]CCN59170.1 hypothetical protein MADA3029_360026 [Vibrio nigripulchritudo MADA3029]